MVMGRFGKKKKDDDESEGLASVFNDAESSLEDLDDDVNNDGDGNEESALLGQFFKVDDNDDGDAEEEEKEDEADSLADDLMDIFTSEESEETDLAALTKDLVDVDVNELLAEARDIVTRLRSYFG